MKIESQNFHQVAGTCGRSARAPVVADKGVRRTIAREPCDEDPCVLSTELQRERSAGISRKAT